MAVEVRYHVIRDGKEVAMYLTKKEADEHDKMLDIAFNLSEFIEKAEQLELDENALEELTIYLSKNRSEVIQILRAQKPRPPQVVDPPPSSPPEKEPEKGKKPRRKKTAPPKKK
jgi:uncharacterized protein